MYIYKYIYIYYKDLDAASFIRLGVPERLPINGVDCIFFCKLSWSEKAEYSVHKTKREKKWWKRFCLLCYI